MSPLPVPPPIFDDEEPLVPRRLALELRNSLTQIADLNTEFHNLKYALFNITNQINSICLSPDPGTQQHQEDLRRLNTELHLTRRQITEMQFQIANQKRIADMVYESIISYDAQEA